MSVYETLHIEGLDNSLMTEEMLRNGFTVGDNGHGDKCWRAPDGRGFYLSDCGTFMSFNHGTIPDLVLVTLCSPRLRWKVATWMIEMSRIAHWDRLEMRERATVPWGWRHKEVVDAN
jgi:hypothetical protein